MPSACTRASTLRVLTPCTYASAIKSVPPELQVRIRERIRGSQSNSWFTAGFGRWAVATAATLVVCAGVWLNYSRETMPALADRAGQNAYIRRVSATLDTVLKVGLGDHIHCSIFRKYPQNPPPVEEMEDKLGIGAFV